MPSDTKRLEFTGYSDDTFACRGPGIDVDHDNCGNGKPIYFRVVSAEGSLVVSGRYAPGPCAGWLIGVSHDGDPDDDTLPDWPMRYEVNPDVTYSPLLVIDAPADVEVIHVRL